jgi:hypothetical protein
MAKRKRTEGQNATQNTKDRAKRTPLITGGELVSSGRVSSWNSWRYLLTIFIWQFNLSWTYGYAIDAAVYQWRELKSSRGKELSAQKSNYNIVGISIYIYYKYTCAHAWMFNVTQMTIFLKSLKLVYILYWIYNICNCGKNI